MYIFLILKLFDLEFIYDLQLPKGYGRVFVKFYPQKRGENMKLTGKVCSQMWRGYTFQTLDLSLLLVHL